MNTETSPATATASAPVVSAPAPVPAKAKGKGKAKVTATVAPSPANPARDALIASVKAAIESAKGKPQDESLVILREALAKVHATCPDVELSSNKEQRTAQLKTLRESRANLGWQVAARMIGDAINAVNGVDVTHRYSARQLVNGSLVSVETRRATLKASKSHRGISIR